MNAQTEARLTSRTAALTAACVESCEQVMAQIAAVRDGLFAEWRQMLATRERVLQLALNEAEAIAWQTGVPHLVFPALAEEKVRAAVRWGARQQSLNPGRRLVQAG